MSLSVLRLLLLLPLVVLGASQFVFTMGKLALGPIRAASLLKVVAKLGFVLALLLLLTHSPLGKVLDCYSPSSTILLTVG